MHRRIGRFTIALLTLIAVLTPLAASAAEITVYKSPYCGCCGGWVAHMRSNGHSVKTIDLEDLSTIKKMTGVGEELQSCHTAVVDGYVIEGHVPAQDVARLLAGAQASLGGLGVHEISFLSAPRHAGPSNRVLTIADENAPIVRALQGADSTFYENTFDYRKEPVWAATRAMPELGIALVVKFDRSEREEPLPDLRVTIRKYAVALASFSILIGILMGLRFAAPIHALVDVVERIEAGGPEGACPRAQ